MQIAYCSPVSYPASFSLILNFLPETIFILWNLLFLPQSKVIFFFSELVYVLKLSLQFMQYILVENPIH